MRKETAQEWRIIMKGFGLDGKLFKGLTKAGDFLILALITFIFCIPVVTIGASLTAAFYSGMKLVKDEENYVFKDFIKSFKENFLQGLIVEIILAAAGLLLFLDIRACAYWAFTGSGSMIGTIFMYAIVGCAIVWAGVVLYAFAMLSRYDDKALRILKNSLILCVHHLPQTIVMMIATYGLMIFSYQYFTAYIITIPLVLYIDSFIFTRIFKSLENTNEQRAQEAAEEKKAAAGLVEEEKKVAAELAEKNAAENISENITENTVENTAGIEDTDFTGDDSADKTNGMD
jgi:uncharacterized membrane protein YesL